MARATATKAAVNQQVMSIQNGTESCSSEQAAKHKGAHGGFHADDDLHAAADSQSSERQPSMPPTLVRTV